LKKGRIGAAFPGRNPAAPVAGGEGKVGEELEETELYPFVGSNEVGDGQRCAPRGEQWAAATAARGGGASTRGSGSGVVGELHQAMEKLARGLARAEEGRKRELRGGSGDGGGHVGRRCHSGIGAARLGFVREGEWRGRVETPLGEANGEGESLAGEGAQ